MAMLSNLNQLMILNAIICVCLYGSVPDYCHPYSDNSINFVSVFNLHMYPNVVVNTYQLLESA